MTLTKWYEKTVYAIGWVVVILFLFGFFVGLTADIIQNNQANGLQLQGSSVQVQFPSANLQASPSQLQGSDYQLQ